MHKKIIIFLLLIISAGIALLLTVQVGDFHAKAKLKEGRSNTFPVISLLSLQQTAFNTRPLADVPVYKLVVIVDPECDHCDFEMDEIVRNAGKFKDAYVLFISPKPVAELQKFAHKIKNTGFSNINIFSLRHEDLFRHFNGNPFPDIYLYGKDNKLIKNFWGETPSGLILAEMN